MLTKNETIFFNDVLNNFKKVIDVEIPIIPYDHTILTGKSKEALGLAWSYDKKVVYQITIDEECISACYSHYLWENNLGGCQQLYGNCLVEIMCHEVAHAKYWRHGKKHTELQNELKQRFVDYFQIPVTNYIKLKR